MCIHSVTRSYFTTKHPSLKYHVSSNSKNLILDLLDGECTVSMSQGLHFDALGEGVDALDICEFYYHHDIYNMYVSQPSSGKYSQALSALSVQVENKGKYLELYNKFFTSYGALCLGNIEGGGRRGRSLIRRSASRTFWGCTLSCCYSSLWLAQSIIRSYTKVKRRRKMQVRSGRRSTVQAAAQVEAELSGFKSG